ncbi:regulator of nonsense transcripts UPF3-like [Nymphaea colorata]|nr:regulator of nonsense transcripts UPF3-like [Nymphaea colorata]
MKDPLDRTKVVLRHLPPSISQAVLMEQVDARFAGRYRWTAFRPGKTSHKNMRYARAYIDFKRPEDVLEFAEFFDGHVFVNEKGSQFKTIVEYAPSQRVPKSWSKKDGREGTIHKDSEYLEFLEMLAKPVENLPSAEIQLERREAERASAPKETIVITPLMEFVRQKRATKNGSQRTPSGKLSRRTSASAAASGSASHKRGPEKRKISASMYVLRDNTKVSAGKTSYTIVARKDEKKTSDDSGTVPVLGSEVLEDESGASGHAETGKKKVILLKGKEREVTSTSPVKNSSGPSSFKQNHRREISGKLIRSILSNKEAQQNQPQPASIQVEQQLQASPIEKDKRPPRPVRTVSKDSAHASSASLSQSDNRRISDEKVIGNDPHGLSPASDKPDRRTRNKDRPDRGVWAPLRRSDALQAVDESSSFPGRSSAEAVDSTQVAKPMVSNKRGDDGLETRDVITDNQSAITVKSRNQGTSNHHGRSGRGLSLSPDFPLNHGEAKVDTASTRGGEAKSQGFGRNSVATAENGSHRYGRRVSATGSREVDNLPSTVDGKSSKRGSPGYGAHEKQVWVQKSGSGS